MKKMSKYKRKGRRGEQVFREFFTIKLSNKIKTSGSKSNVYTYKRKYL